MVVEDEAVGEWCSAFRRTGISALELTRYAGGMTVQRMDQSSKNDYRDLIEK